MAGRATLTTVASRAATNVPRIAASRARRLRRSVTHPCYGERRPRPRTASDAVPSHLGCSPPRPPPRGLYGFRAAGLATPGPRSLRLGSASGRKLGWGPMRGQGLFGGDPANTADFRSGGLPDLVHWVVLSARAAAVSTLAIDGLRPAFWSLERRFPGAGRGWVGTVHRPTAKTRCIWL